VRDAILVTFVAATFYCFDHARFRLAAVGLKLRQMYPITRGRYVVIVRSPFFSKSVIALLIRRHVELPSYFVYG
jgi:hypothetical protein